MRIPRLICFVSLALSGAALAQNPSGDQGGPANQSTAPESASPAASSADENIAPVRPTMERRSTDRWQGAEIAATLSSSVDARKAKPGDAVTATLAQDLRANGRLLLLQGTTLVGRVTEAQARTRHADGNTESRLGIVFERAVLNDGREVPVGATIQAVAVAEGGASSGAVGGLDATGQLASGSRGVFGLSGVQIVTAASADAHGSGSVLTSQSSNVALDRGTRLLLVAGGQGG